MIDVELYYNKYQNYYERNHIYIPDDVGYADHRVSMQVDNNNVEYFPDLDVWRFNKIKVFGVYVFDKLDIKDEEPLFWACLKKSVGSERCHFNWNDLICPEPSYSFDFESNVVCFLDVSDRPSCKRYEEALLPLIGEIEYIGTDRKYHIYKSEKYGVIKMSKEINNEKRIIIFEESNRFPKTVEFVRKHQLFTGE